MFSDLNKVLISWLLEIVKLHSASVKPVTNLRSNLSFVLLKKYFRFKVLTWKVFLIWEQSLTRRSRAQDRDFFIKILFHTIEVFKNLNNKKKHTKKARQHRRNVSKEFLLQTPGGGYLLNDNYIFFTTQHLKRLFLLLHASHEHKKLFKNFNFCLDYVINTICHIL